jgi:hypothetical protein
VSRFAVGMPVPSWFTCFTRMLSRERRRSAGELAPGLTKGRFDASGLRVSFAGATVPYKLRPPPGGRPLRNLTARHYDAVGRPGGHAALRRAALEQSSARHQPRRLVTARTHRHA